MLKLFKAIVLFSVFSVLSAGWTSIAQAALEPPQTLSPAAYVTDRSPSFDWSDVPGAASYEFMLLDETDATVYFSQAGIGESTFAIAGAVFDQSKVYHWRVRGFDAAGNPSAWSPIESFLIYDPAIVPVVSAPAGYITTVTPLFQWAPVANAVSYELWILTEDELTTINRIGGLESASYQQPANQPLLPYTVYHYKVRARMPDGTVSLWSNPGSFLMYSPVDTPTLIGPKQQAPIGQTTLSWMPLENAVSYDVLLLTADEQTILVNERNVPTNAYSPRADVGFVGNQIYHWRVRAVLANGARSLWSDTLSYVAFDPLIVPNPLLPFGFITTSRPVLEWTQINNAVAYRVELRDSATQALLLSDEVASPATIYNLYGKIAIKRDVAYDWRVRAVLADGSMSVWSQPRGFKLTTALWEGLITKNRTHHSYYPTQKVSFSWLPLALPGLGQIRYTVTLREQPLNGAARTLWIGDSTLANPSMVTLPLDVPLEQSTVHAWVVQAFDTTGTLIGTSRKSTFRTPGPAPESEYQARIEEYRTELEATYQKLLADQAAKRATRVAAHATRLNDLKAALDALLARNQAALAAQATAQELQRQALVKSQASRREALAKSHEGQVASQQRTHASQDASLVRTNASQVSALTKAQTSELSALAKIHAAELTALKKQSGVTPEQIQNLTAKHAQVKAEAASAHQTARGELEKKQKQASEALKAQQATDRERLAADHPQAITALEEKMAAETAALATKQGDSRRALEVSQSNAVLALEQKIEATKVAQAASLAKLDEHFARARTRARATIDARVNHLVVKLGREHLKVP